MYRRQSELQGEHGTNMTKSPFTESSTLSPEHPLPRFYKAKTFTPFLHDRPKRHDRMGPAQLRSLLSALEIWSGQPERDAVVFQHHLHKVEPSVGRKGSAEIGTVYNKKATLHGISPETPQIRYIHPEGRWPGQLSPSSVVHSYKNNCLKQNLHQSHACRHLPMPLSQCTPPAKNSSLQLAL